MKSFLSLLLVVSLGSGFALGSVAVDEEAFGNSLGGWKKKNKQTAEYPLSGSLYRTYRPEISKTPEGGIFLSIRIDHVRGWLSSDDHAMLEVTVSPQGVISSAKSNIAIQGRSITSDVIIGTTEVGQELSGANQAVQIGTDLVSDLTSKLLRENIVEAGRVSFPSAIRHNYNLLYQALRVNDAPVQPLQVAMPVPPSVPEVAPKETPTQQAAMPPSEPPSTESKPAVEPEPEAESEPKEEPPPVAKPVPGNSDVGIQPFGAPPADAKVVD